jgi:hypothetical protein
MLLVELLAHILDEGRALADRKEMEVNWRWVEQALANIRAYQKEFSDALEKRDALALAHAAGQFVSIRKYFWDTPLNWSKLEKELLQCAEATAEKAGKVEFSINPFDPVNLAEIQRIL